MVLIDDQNVRETSRVSTYEGTARIPVQEQPRVRGVFPPVEDRERMGRYVLAGGSALAGLAGIAGAVLAIIGLAGYYPVTLLSIAAIVLGGALLCESLGLRAWFISMTHNLQNRWLMGFGAAFAMVMTFVAGGGSVILGILALLGHATSLLNPVSAIVLGGGLILGSTANLGFIQKRGGVEPARESTYRLVVGSVFASGGLQLLAGLAGVCLGILALMGTMPLTLNLVAMLVIGASIFLSGSALTGKAAAELK